MPKQRPSWLVVALLAVALVSTAGWAVSARRPAPASQAEAAAAVQANAHAGHDPAAATHEDGSSARNTPAIAPRDGVLAMTVPPLPKNSVVFIWRPEHLVLAAGQPVTLKVANADYMQHNFTFKAAKVAKNLPVDVTTTIKLTAPTKPGVYRFYCKYHLQMMEGAVTVR
ncbi:MAG TPA: cupredoxin domain-containing protein [Actinomycetes bacterium]|jgi:plastocyanin